MEEIHLGGKRSRKEEDEGGGGRVAIGGMTFLPWQNPASRICRVSRASGGKDRHSKVLTAKGLRDRRVRLSVSTAIQFYDLQDRLGYDQPSKAVEWLIKAASTAISELPSLDSAFAELSTRFARRSSSSAAADENGHDAADAPPQVIPPNDQRHNPQHVSLTRSTCSSNSETSRGSVLSLSRSENRRAKARERAKERCAAREKGGGGGEGGDEDDAVGGSSHQLGCNRHPVSQCSFTDLLTGSGCNDSNMVTVAAQANNTDNNGNNYSSRHVRHLAPAVTADYFGQGSISQQKPPPHHHVVPASAQAAHFANGSPVGVMPFNFALATTGGGGDGEHHSEIHHHQQQQQQLPFLQDHIIPVVASGGDYNLNFSISSSGGLAAFNRGTLQSNSPSLMSHIHHLQRLSSSQADGSNLPFFFGAPHLPAASASGENPFPAAIDGRLQICYGDSYRHSDIKGKGEN